MIAIYIMANSNVFGMVKEIMIGQSATKRLLFGIDEGSTTKVCQVAEKTLIL